MQIRANSKFRFSAVFLAGALLLVSSCKDSIPENGTENFDRSISAFYVGLAALQAGDDQRALAELTRAAGLAPGEPAAWNNLGVLQMRQNNSDEAANSLERAAKLAPDEARIYFNLAILAGREGDSNTSAHNFRRVLEIDPRNAKALYAIAVENERQQKAKDALQSYNLILKDDPANLAGLVEKARLEAKLGDRKAFGESLAAIENLSRDWPGESKDQLEKLKASSISGAPSGIAFLRNLLLRVPAFRASLEAIKPSDVVVGELYLKPLRLPAPDFSPAEPDTKINFRPDRIARFPANSASVLFLDGYTAVTVVFGKNSTRIGDFEIQKPGMRSANFAVLDYDYDYKNDIAYAGEAGFGLYKQISKGKFENVTATTGVTREVSRKRYNGAWAFDFDSEGDLDILLSAKASAPFVLRNNGNGTFEPVYPFEGIDEIKDFDYGDLDEDGDSDAVFLLRTGGLRVYTNQRGGIFKQFPKSVSENIAAISIGDSDGDGSLDLNSVSTDGEISREGFGAKAGVVKSGYEKCEALCGLLLSDIDNNGANDLIVTDGSSTRILLGNGKEFISSVNLISASVKDLADLDHDGKIDMVGIDLDGNAVRMINRSDKNYHWQILRPKSVKTEGDQRINTYGIGGEMEIRAGLLAQKQLIRTPQVHFGLGAAAKADVVRVVWQNGYVQAEFDLNSDQEIAAVQRLKGSCPHLFAWNGKEFAHVKDAPPWSPALGLKINAQDTYGILQTEEWFKIPGNALKPKDGFYELRITGEYWESFYLDHYRLLAVDHPSDTEIFTDERFSIPLPPLEVFTTAVRKAFSGASDQNGTDVASIIGAEDGNYLGGFPLGRFQGVAEDHYLELELPPDAPLDKQLWIVADGWVHPTDASINVQRGQGVSRPPRSLSIEIEDGKGGWKTAKENLGFPAGKMKTVLLDLNKVFGANTKSRKLRLRTEMEIYWDRLAWATADQGLSNDTSEILIDSAELRYRGFSVIEKPANSMPEVPDYNRILTTEQRWRDLEGFYTRFGDVKQLLTKVDDRIVLANAGDELVLKFPALRPVKKGYVRDFVIIGNGWIKDGDLNSVFSGTVLPLPTRSSNDYSRPPTKLEDDPVYQQHRPDWIDYHTRYVSADRFRNAIRKFEN